MTNPFRNPPRAVVYGLAVAVTAPAACALVRASCPAGASPREVHAAGFGGVPTTLRSTQ